MNLPFFESGINSGFIQQPNDDYRELQQAFIDSQWDNTSARVEIQEQDWFGSKTYHKIEAWINKAIGTTTTFMKNGEDYRQLIFKEIEKPCIRGRLYKFENNYWLTDFTNPSQGLVSDIIVRRCNNFLRIIDPQNGAIYSEPCVVDYDMQSPSVQVSSYVITPNNHAVVFVQANEYTRRLFKLNTRYMLGGRPFKLYAFQNALWHDLDNPEPTVLYLDLYLDELHAQDNVEQQLAYNGDYLYTIKIQSDSISLPVDSTGTLTVDTTLNGVETQCNIYWSSSDSSIVCINQNGEYQVNGEVGQSATITAQIVGNDQLSDAIIITVADMSSVPTVVYLNPAMDTIRQYESIEFSVECKQTEVIVPETIRVSLSETDEVLSNEWLEIQALGGNRFNLTCTNIAPELQTIYVHVENTNPVFTLDTSFIFTTTSMFG